MKVETLNHKGNTLRSLKRYEEAIRCYDRAIEISPNYKNAMKNKKRAEWKPKEKRTIEQEVKIEDISRLKSLRDVDRLISALGDEYNAHKFVREAAAHALGKIGDERAAEPLINALEDEKEDVRWTAAEALGEIGDVRAVEPLMRAFRDGDDIMRSDAEYALGKIADSVVESLINALRDSDWIVFQGIDITTVAGHTGDERAVKPVIKAHRSGDEGVCESAIATLCKIGERAVEPLIAALGDSDEWLRLGVAAALCQIAEPAISL